MSQSPFILVLFLLPLAGSALNGFFGKGWKQASGWFATAVSFGSFAFAVGLTAQLAGGGSLVWAMDWLQVGQFVIKLGFRFDSLTAVMTLMVTGIGSLIHLYSIGYMAQDEGRPRFFAYLNLFLAAMLILVTSDSLIGLFVGWEGVGVCSYLLIGFWYTESKNAAAGQKAFLVNRIGDAGFLLGIFMCLKVLGTVRFEEMRSILATATMISPRDLGWISLLLFIGAMGKSAQIPLYVWLPDAMVGPTPVSALIHAATMVIAGVYLVVRMGFFFQISEDVSHFIALIGVFTALFAATIACVQRDIKKVLAYSTISQLGLMFVGAGAGNYAASLFHVITHAFFKACLFLGAGSVIHALEGEQDIAKMGGLRKLMPITNITFLISVVAISGVPPFAGFFSKDAILYSAAVSEKAGVFVWTLGLLTSLLTAYYMMRLYCLAFLGSYRGAHHPHESPAVMTLPLCVLALGAVVGGVFSLPHEWHLVDYLGHWLSGIVPVFHSADAGFISEAGAMLIAVIVGGLGIVLAFVLHGRSVTASFLETVPNALWQVFWNKYWVDELYEALFVGPYRRICRFLARWVDVFLIDGLVLGFSKMVSLGALTVSGLQNGRIQSYLMLFMVGVVAMAAWLIYGGGA